MTGIRKDNTVHAWGGSSNYKEHGKDAGVYVPLLVFLGCLCVGERGVACEVRCGGDVRLTD